MRKLSLALAILLGLALPSAAMAQGFSLDHPHDPNSNSDDDQNNDQNSDDHDSQWRHQHLDDQYDDVTGVVVPPIAVKPGHQPDPNQFDLPNIPNPDVQLDNSFSPLPDPLLDALNGVVDPNSDYKTTTLDNSTIVSFKLNPNTQPIQVKKLNITTKTPTDDFMQSAGFMGAGLGTVAFGLVSFTSYQSLRARRAAKINKA